VTVVAASTEVVVASIAAVASVSAAVVTAVLGGRLRGSIDAKLKEKQAELDEAQKERDAQRDYRYEAMKRLYADLQPVFFQLADVCETGYRHTRRLAERARAGSLGAGEQSWMRDPYFLLATIYQLLVPIGVVGVLQRRLTTVDLTVDPSVAAQYRFARGAIDAWISGFDLAAVEPPLEYRPHDPEAPARKDNAPAVFRVQHLYTGQVDRIASLMIVSDDAGRAVRHCTFTEFEDRQDADPLFRKRLAPAIELFREFDPLRHPVLWRMLVAQAHLYRAIAQTVDDRTGTIIQPVDLMDDDARARFDVRPNAEAAGDDAFSAARLWLARSAG
jgi:hypothetical protein